VAGHIPDKSLSEFERWNPLLFIPFWNVAWRKMIGWNETKEVYASQTLHINMHVSHI